MFGSIQVETEPYYSYNIVVTAKDEQKKKIVGNVWIHLTASTASAKIAIEVIRQTCPSTLATWKIEKKLYDHLTDPDSSKIVPEGLLNQSCMEVKLVQRQGHTFCCFPGIHRLSQTTTLQQSGSSLLSANEVTNSSLRAYSPLEQDFIQNLNELVYTILPGCKRTE